jgi:hypothetical protein
MANLLLKQTKLKVTWQKWRHISIVLTVAIVVAVLLAAASLLPVVIYTQILGKGVGSKVAGVVSTDVGVQRQKATRTLGEYKKFVAGLQAVDKMTNANEIARRVVGSIISIDLVSLTLLDIKYTDTGYSVTVSGGAQTRDAVVALKDVLEKSPDIDVTDFPISNFALKDGQYNYRAVLYIKGNIENHE